MPVRVIIAGVVAAVVTPMILDWLSRQHAPSRTEGNTKVLEYPTAYSVVMVVGCLFFLALAGLAWRFPGRTDPAKLPWVIAGFVAFAILSAWTFALLGRARVYWNGQGLRGPDALGRISRMTWDEVVSVEYVAWATGFRLKNAAGAVIWVSPMMGGFDEFFEAMKARCGPRGLMAGLEGFPEE